MTSRASDRWREWYATWAPEVRSGPATVRGVVAGAGAAAAALLASGLGVLVLVGALLAAVAPRRVGAAPFVVVAVIAWAGAYGRGGQPPALTLVLFAVLVQVVQSATALAAAVPLDAQLVPGAGTRWAVGALPGIGLAVALGAVAAIIERTGTLPGGPVLDVVGAVGVLAAVLAIALLVRRAGDAGSGSRRSSNGS